MKVQLPFWIVLFACTLTAATDTYFCPMRCEGKKIYSKPGTCPVCHMNLEREGAQGIQLNSLNYRVDLITSPAVVESGKPVTLRFEPRKTSDNQRVPLETVHEKPFHLVLVSQDLQWFLHEHPQVEKEGSYVFQTTFPHGGNYVLYADIKPKGGQSQVFPLALQVKGTSAPAKKLKPDWQRPVKLEGYTISLLKPVAPKVGSTCRLKYRVEFNRKPVINFENHLGTQGHLIAISEDTTQFVHAHGSSAENTPVFDIHFPRAGLYRIWAQFRHQGKSLIAGHVVKVD